MDKQPFSQRVVGVLALGVIASVLGGFALKWFDESRSNQPTLISTGATATFHDQTTSPLPESQSPAAVAASSAPVTASSNTRPHPDSLSRQRSASANETLTKSERTDPPDPTQAASRSDLQRRAGYLAATHLPNRVEFLVCAETAGKAPMGAFTTALAEHLNKRGRDASGFVFSPEFITSGAFDLYFVGRGGTDLQAMPVSSMGRKLFLARVSNSVKPGTVAGGLFTASIVATFSVLSSDDGSAVDGFELRAVGPGTSETDAVSQALQRILEELGRRGY